MICNYDETTRRVGKLVSTAVIRSLKESANIARGHGPRLNLTRLRPSVLRRLRNAATAVAAATTTTTTTITTTTTTITDDDRPPFFNVVLLRCVFVSTHRSREEKKSTQAHTLRHHKDLRCET
jgi:hypothetical protein